MFLIQTLASILTIVSFYCLVNTSGPELVLYSLIALILGPGSLSCLGHVLYENELKTLEKCKHERKYTL